MLRIIHQVEPPTTDGRDFAPFVPARRPGNGQVVAPRASVRRIHLRPTVSLAVFDVETVGDHRGEPIRNEVTWIALATMGRADVIPMGHPNGEFIRDDYPLLPSGELRIAEGKKLRKTDTSKDHRRAVPVFTPAPAQLRPAQVFKALEPLLYSPTKTKIGHGVKFDLETIAKYYGGRIAPPPYDDTMVVEFVLDSTRHGRLGLDDCCAHELGYKMVKGVGKEVEKYAFSVVAKYAMLDARYTWLLRRELVRLLPEDGLQPVYDLEMAITQVIAHMELRGARIDAHALAVLDKDLRVDLDRIEGEVYRAANKVFNINSVPEKQHALFAPKADGGRGLKGRKLTASGLNRKRDGAKADWKDYSTDQESLAYLEERYNDPLVNALSQHSTTGTLIKNICVPYLGGTVSRTTLGKTRMIERESLLVAGRIHGDFVQTGAETREFCVDPETLIEMPRNMSLYPDGVPLRNVKQGDWVYTFSWDRRLMLRPVLWVGPTKVADTVVVTIKDRFGKVTKLTASHDHLARKIRGEWVPVGALKPDDRLLGMLQRNYNDDGYAFFPPSKKRALPGKTTGGKIFEHRLVQAQCIQGRDILPVKWDVHHEDHNKINNAPDNLRLMLHTSHVRMHKKKTTPEQVQAMLDGGALTVSRKHLGRLAREYALRPTNHTVISVEQGPNIQLWNLDVDSTHTFIGADVALYNCARSPDLEKIPAGQARGIERRTQFVSRPRKGTVSYSLQGGPFDAGLAQSGPRRTSQGNTS